jgi:hypothetical protein
LKRLDLKHSLSPETKVAGTIKDNVGARGRLNSHRIHPEEFVEIPAGGGADPTIVMMNSLMAQARKA